MGWPIRASPLFFNTCHFMTISLKITGFKNNNKMPNPILSSLPTYVEQNATGLIAQSVLGSRTTSIIDFMSGVKTSAALNILSTDVQFQNGDDCGFEAAGSQEISQRVLETGQIKVQTAYCDKNFLKTYAQYQVKIAAGQKTLPFEEDFINEVIKNIKANLEKAVWQGDKASEDANLNKFDGLIKILGAANGVIAATGSKTDVFAALQDVLVKLPATALKEDTRIFVGDDTFMRLVNELVNKNLYHYSGENANYEIVLPGTTIRVTAVEGLNGTDKIVAGRASNFVYGTDMEGDEEKFDFWYSEDNREFRLNVEFNAGVQVKFPDEVVLVTLS